MADSESSKKQVFDVSHPGTSTPSATSKPVITGSGTMMKDPMMQEKPTDSDKAKDDNNEKDGDNIKVTTTKKGKTIQPLSDDVSADTDNVDTNASETKKPPEPEATFTSESADTAPPSTDKSSDNTENDSDEGEPKNAIVDAVLDQTTGGKNSTKQVSSEFDDTIQEHIDNKTYFVKISHASSSNSVSVLIILVLLAVIVAVFYVANQRGIISIF
jgi:hypothetical protein